MSRALTYVVALVAAVSSGCSERDPVELIRAIPNPDPDPGERFGRVHRIDRDFVVAVELDDAHGVPEAGTVYAFDGETGDLLHAITSPAPEAGAHFGAVVLARGSRELVIAAPFADVAGVVDAGAIYVYSATGELRQAIPNPEPIASDQFGLNMLATDDGFAVRVPGPTGDGRVYRYFHDFDGDFEARVLDDPTPNETQEFGKTMYWTGAHLVVGSPAATVGGVSEAGLITVYDGEVVLRELPNPAPALGARFGAHLGAAGANPVATTAAGSPVLVVLSVQTAEILETIADAGMVRNFGDLFGVGFAVLHPDEGAGSVTIYTPSGPRSIPNPDPHDGDRFGRELVADSSSRLFILSPADDRDGLADAGSVYVVHPSSSLPGSEYFLHIQSPSRGAAFGTDLELVSGGTLVSAPGEDEPDVDEAGAVYLFEQEVPRFRFRIPNPEPGASDRFGEHALEGMGNTFVIGARADDPDGVADAGSVYLYRIDVE